MCLCFIYFTSHPNSKIKFLILFNREEFLKRPAESFGFHPIDGLKQNYLLYPLDVPTKGTYLSLNTKNGNFSFLLNNSLKSNSYNVNCRLKRGSLPLEFCKLDDQENNWNIFFEKLNKDKAEYNGFNIICGNFKNRIVKYYTNNSEDIKFNSENLVKNNYKNVQFGIFDKINCFNSIEEINKNENEKSCINELINPITKNEYLNFDCNVPLSLKEDKVYVISNSFIFDGDKRVNFGGKIFKQILEEKCYLFSNNGDCSGNNEKDSLGNQDNEVSCEDLDNKTINTQNDFDIEKFVKTFFSDLLGNTEKLESNRDEVVQIIKTDKNWATNAIVDDYVSSSLFIKDKIDEFYIEYGTRNSHAIILDNENCIKIYNIDDKVIEENGRLTKRKRDLEIDVEKMKFKL